MKGIDDVAREFVEVFDRLGMPYALMGGLAVRIHALPRPTFDVDFTVASPRNKLPDVYRMAEELGYSIPEPQRTGWVDQVRDFPEVKFQFFIGGRAIDVDVFLAETPFQRQLLARRKKYVSDKWGAWFVTPEDLILLKLMADRPKDRTDVSDILFIQGQLDESYLRKWAESLGMEDRLNEALNRRDG